MGKNLSLSEHLALNVAIPLNWAIARIKIGKMIDEYDLKDPKQRGQLMKNVNDISRKALCYDLKMRKSVEDKKGKD